MIWLVILVLIIIFIIAGIAAFHGPRNRSDEQHPTGMSFWDWFF